MTDNDPNATGTLGAMVARIADEIGRSDLSSQIRNAINDAIAVYNNERFYFNETRDFVFNLNQGQMIYTESDFPNVINLLSIDYMYVYQNNYPYRLDPTTPEDLEMLTVGGITLGLPYLYCFYNQAIRVYPMPMNTTYSARVAGSYAVAAPQSDAEAGNPWMTDAERLIRSRAKFELATHVLYDADMATAMGGTSQDADGNPSGGAAGDAFQSLKNRTTLITKIGDGWVKPMQF